MYVKKLLQKIIVVVFAVHLPELIKKTNYQK